MSDESPVQTLLRLSRSFGAGPARRKAELLQRIARIPRLAARELLALQKTLCFLRASPDDAEVLRGVARAAASMRHQLRGARALIDTGVPGSYHSYPYSYPVVRKLASLFPGCLEIDWDKVEDTGPLEGALSLLSTAGEDPGLDDERLTLQEWLRQIGQERRRTSLEYVLDRLERSSFAPKTRAHLYDLCGLPERFALKREGSGLAEVSLAPGRVNYQRREIPRERFDILPRIARPLGPMPRASETDGSRIVDLAVTALSTRNLESIPLHANPRDVTLHHCGRGCGSLSSASSRISSRSRVSLLLSRSENGVPVAYGPAGVFMGCCEMGFNLFPEFRGIAVRPALAGSCDCSTTPSGRYFFLTRYRMGEDNEDAISGAFWFYQLGFATTNPSVEVLARAEEARMQAEPEYRSNRKTLRRLYTEAVLDLSTERTAPWFRQARGSRSRYIEERFGGDRAEAERGSASGSRAFSGSSTGTGTRRLSPVLSLLPELKRWSPRDKARLGKALRAKDAVSEVPAANLFNAHQPLREALLRLAGTVL
jgi:hypothetical protein